MQKKTVASLERRNRTMKFYLDKYGKIPENFQDEFTPPPDIGNGQQATLTPVPNEPLGIDGIGERDAIKNPTEVETRCSKQEAAPLITAANSTRARVYPGIQVKYHLPENCPTLADDPDFDASIPAGQIRLRIFSSAVIKSMSALKGGCAGLFGVFGASRDDFRGIGTTRCTERKNLLSNATQGGGTTPKPQINGTASDNLCGQLNAWQDLMCINAGFPEDCPFEEDDAWAIFQANLSNELSATVVGQEVTGQCTGCQNCSAATQLRNTILKPAVDKALTATENFVTNLTNFASIDARSQLPKLDLVNNLIDLTEQATRHLRFMDQRSGRPSSDPGGRMGCVDFENARTTINQIGQFCGGVDGNSNLGTTSESCTLMQTLINTFLQLAGRFKNTEFFQATSAQPQTICAQFEENALKLPADAGEEGTVLASVEDLSRLGLNVDKVLQFNPTLKFDVQGIGSISLPHKQCRDQYMVCFNNICFTATPDSIKFGTPQVGMLKGVPLMSVGDKTSKGIVFTRLDFEQMILSHEKLKHTITPPMKLGHNNRLINGSQEYSLAFDKGRPALGWIENLQLHPNNPDILIGDIIGIPHRLHKFLSLGKQSPFRRESIEVVTDFIDADKKIHGKLIVGVAMLGEDIPFEINLDSLEKWELLYYPEDVGHLNAIPAQTTQIISSGSAQPMATAFGLNVDRIIFEPSKAPCKGCKDKSVIPTFQSALPASTIPTISNNFGDWLRADIEKHASVFDQLQLQSLETARLDHWSKLISEWHQSGILAEHNIEPMRVFLYSIDPFITTQQEIPWNQLYKHFNRMLETEIPLVEAV